MDEFNFENAEAFLDECSKNRAAKAESERRVIFQLAPKIREMEAEGFSKSEIYGLLAERFGLKVSFNTFRNYLNGAKAKDRKESGK